MNRSPRLFLLLLLFPAIVWLTSCAPSGKLAGEEDFTPAEADASRITAEMPDYNDRLHTLRGRGRAIVSEPGNTERVTLLISSNRAKSKVTIRNSLGIEGGQLLTDGDTLTVYNKLDKYVRKIPVAGGDLTHINRLASLNILDIINYTVEAGEVRTVLENNAVYKLELRSGAEVYVDKQSFLIRQVVQPPESNLPYAEISYDSYGSLEEFRLPQQITIIGAAEKSKITLQLTSLELNTKLDSLTITIPDDIPVYHQ